MRLRTQHRRATWSLPWLVLCLSTSLSAQGPTLGLKLGASQSSRVQPSVGIIGSDRSPAREAPTVALAATFPVRGPLGLQVELAYVPKGANPPGATLLRSSYLELPVLIRIAPWASRAARPVAVLGVAPAYELSCGGLETQPTVGDWQPVVRERDCSGARQTRYDVGMVGGLGVELPVRRAVFTADVRYTHGLQNLYPRFQFVRVYNRSVAVLFGVRSSGKR